MLAVCTTFPLSLPELESGESWPGRERSSLAYSNDNEVVNIS